MADGLAHYCRSCKRDADAKTREKHGDKYRHLRAENYKNAAKVREASARRVKEWQLRNVGRKPELDKALRQKRRASNAGDIPRLGTKYCWSCASQVLREEFYVSRSNKDGLYGQCVPCCRSRNSKRRSAGTFTNDEWLARLHQFDGKCAYGGDCAGKLHADHFVPISKNGCGTINNVVPACERHNLQKGSKEPHNWIASKYGEDHPLFCGVPPLKTRKAG